MTFDKSYDKVMNKRYEFITNYITNFILQNYNLDEHHKLNIIDIGCGNCKISNNIKYIFKGSINIYGVDRYKYFAKNNVTFIEVLDLNYDSINVKDSLADIIICSQVVEHLWHPDNLFHEIRRILKQNGIAIITNHNLNIWINRLRFLYGKFPKGMSLTLKNANSIDSYHIRTYGLDALKKICINFGFSILNTKSFIGYVPDKSLLRSIINMIYIILGKIYPGLGQTIMIVIKKYNSHALD